MGESGDNPLYFRMAEFNQHNHNYRIISTIFLAAAAGALTPKF
jgi:hypothetical protein